MTAGRRRLQQQLLAQAPQTRHSGGPTGTVVAIQPGASQDGVALISVRVKGGTYQLPYYRHYTPQLNDVVGLELRGGQWTVIGAIVGFPPNPNP